MNHDDGAKRVLIVKITVAKFGILEVQSVNMMTNSFENIQTQKLLANTL